MPAARCSRRAEGVVTNVFPKRVNNLDVLRRAAMLPCDEMVAISRDPLENWLRSVPFDDASIFAAVPAAETRNPLDIWLRSVTVQIGFVPSLFGRSLPATGGRVRNGFVFGRRPPEVTPILSIEKSFFCRLKWVRSVKQHHRPNVPFRSGYPAIIVLKGAFR